jgi:predicted nucleotidyltransferase
MTQIGRLLASLNEARVRYIVIGATAMAVHGAVRATLDLDLFVDKAPANLARLRKALSDFGYDVTDATVEDFAKFKILLRQYDLPLDLHPFARGVKDFQALWKRRVMAKLGGVNVPVVALADLMKMKKAAGRGKDKEDLRMLRRVSRGEGQD